MMNGFYFQLLSINGVTTNLSIPSVVYHLLILQVCELEAMTHLVDDFPTSHVHRLNIEGSKIGHGAKAPTFFWHWSIFSFVRMVQIALTYIYTYIYIHMCEESSLFFLWLYIGGIVTTKNSIFLQHVGHRSFKGHCL